MLNLYIGYCQKLYTQHCHFLYIVNLLITSDRHVTQNALELKGFEWNDKARTITGKIELIDTFPLTMRIRIPKDYSFKKIECKDLNHSVSTENNEILAITFIAKKKGYYSFILKF